MIYVGIGGWVFEEWRGGFYPKGLPQKRELEYASSHLTAIEINGTYYGSQKPESFRKWRSETPDGFVFSLKGPRFATNRRVLAEAGESITRFFDSGVTEPKDKLGYPPAALKTWAQRARDWADGNSPKASMLLAPAAPKKKRDVFLFVISGAKE